MEKAEKDGFLLQGIKEITVGNFVGRQEGADGEGLAAFQDCPANAPYWSFFLNKKQINRALEVYKNKAQLTHKINCLDARVIGDDFLLKSKI